MGLRIGTNVAPKVAVIRAVVWSVASLVFLDVSWAKIVDLQAEGQDVSPWRYAQVAFWVFMIGFWLYQGWRSWHVFRAGRKVVQTQREVV